MFNVPPKNIKNILTLAFMLVAVTVLLTLSVFYLNFKEARQKEIERINSSMEYIADELVQIYEHSDKKLFVDTVNSFSSRGIFHICRITIRSDKESPVSLQICSRHPHHPEYAGEWEIDSESNRHFIISAVFNLDYIYSFYVRFTATVLLLEMLFVLLIIFVAFLIKKQKKLNEELNKRSLLLQKRLILYDKTKSALEESEKQFRMFFDQNPASVWIEDFTDLFQTFNALKARGIEDLESYLDEHPDELKKMAGQVHILDVNKQTVNIYEADSKESFMQGLPQVFTENSFRTFKKQICAFYTGQTYFEMETENKTLKGRKFDVLIAASIQTDSPFRKLGIVTIIDISEHKKLERRILQLATILENISEMVIVTDTNGRIEYVNPAFEKNTGYNRFEIINQNPRFLQSGETPSEIYPQLWDTITAGRTWRGSFKNKRKDGTIFQEEAYIFPLKNEQGEIRHFVGVKRDVTNEKEMEEKLLQSQKMEAVGQLAGGIAHDFNNLLTVILGYSDIVMKLVSPDEKISKYISQIFQSARRAENLTKQLLAFSRKQLIQPRIINLNELLKNFENLIFRTAGENIEIIFSLDESLGNIMADPNQIEQIILNLVLNARDAMPQGGTLTISTFNYRLSKENSTRQEEAMPGWYAGISVKDSGRGMSDDILKHIFEPFFTTKEMGKGTGLGLSTVYGIVTQNHGFIEVQSTPGEGTHFQIYFPLSSALPEEEKTHTPSKKLYGTESILLVEDQEQLREMAIEGLSELGYRIISAANGQIAQKIIDEQGESIDMVVTDVVMPKVSGQELVAYFRKKYPDKPFLYISGYSENILANHGVVNRSLSYLAKPFTVLQLAEAIRNVLEKS